VISRKRQSDIIQGAKERIVTVAQANGIPLVAAYAIRASLIDSDDDGLDVWLFFETDADVESLGGKGTVERVQDSFGKDLLDNGYPADWPVTYHVDSHERVERDFGGSYFDYFR
jgi:hypothetical protein